MDNAQTIEGYKYYVDPHSGERPRVFVAFLDVQPADGADATNGVAFRVAARDLAALDARERNYHRIEVTGAVEPRLDGRVWTYAGTADARDRCERGLAGGNLVVSGDYLTLVDAGFAALGEHALARYRASTDDPPCPVMPLRRVDVAAA